MRRVYPSSATVEGRALDRLQIVHGLYRKAEPEYDERTLLDWRDEARVLAHIVSGRYCPSFWPKR